VEFVFPQGESFKHFDLKWRDYETMSCVPCHDPLLSQRLKDISRKFFAGLNGTGYGRCDIRMSDSGELFMLEINPNCGVYYPPEDPGSADLCLAHDPEGHAGFTRRLIRAALHRHRQRRSAGARLSLVASGGVRVRAAGGQS